MTAQTTSSAMSTELLTARDVIAAEGGVVHTLLRVAPTITETPVRRPVALALVIDRSGSMGDVAYRHDGAAAHVPTKLAFVRRAAERLVDAMPDGDAVAVVSFDDTVRVEAPLTVLDPTTRPQVVRAIRHIACGGSTNLWDGMETGLRLLGADPDDRAAKLLLLTDGMANAGPHVDLPAFVDRCATAAAGGVTVSALGVGLDYPSMALARIADAGNGDFHHVDDPDTLDEAFAEELGAASTPSVRGLSVEVRVPDGVVVEPNLNGYRETRHDERLTVHLGDLTRPKDLVLEVRSPATAVEVLPLTLTVSGTEVAQGQVVTSTVTATLAVVDAADAAAAPVRFEVVQRVVELVDAWSHMQALGAFEVGDADVADTAIAAFKVRVQVLATVYGAVADAAGLAAARAAVDALEQSLHTGAMSPAAMKTGFADASRLARNRPPRRPKQP